MWKMGQVEWGCDEGRGRRRGRGASGGVGLDRDSFFRCLAR